MYCKDIKQQRASQLIATAGTFFSDSIPCRCSPAMIVTVATPASPHDMMVTPAATACVGGRQPQLRDFELAIGITPAASVHGERLWLCKRGNTLSAKQRGTHN